MSDLIDRELLIEQIKEDSYGNEGSYGDMWRFMDTINKLPSAQPDVPDTNVGELISRQAAIDLVESFYKIDKSVLNIMVFKLKQLPSVQPETAKRIVGKSRDGMTLWYQCDMCNEPVDVQDNYCRGCGRRLIDE